MLGAGNDLTAFDFGAIVRLQEAASRSYDDGRHLLAARSEGAAFRYPST
jgi:hypothetical protein